MNKVLCTIQPSTLSFIGIKFTFLYFTLHILFKSNACDFKLLYSPLFYEAFVNTIVLGSYEQGKVIGLGHS